MLLGAPLIGSAAEGGLGRGMGWASARVRWRWLTIEACARLERNRPGGPMKGFPAGEGQAAEAA